MAPNRARVWLSMCVCQLVTYVRVAGGHKHSTAQQSGLHFDSLSLSSHDLGLPRLLNTTTTLDNIDVYLGDLLVPIRDQGPLSLPLTYSTPTAYHTRAITTYYKLPPPTSGKLQASVDPATMNSQPCSKRIAGCPNPAIAAIPERQGTHMVLLAIIL